MALTELITAVQQNVKGADLDFIRKAYSYANLNHKGQTRVSGEPYITHLTDVAILIARLKLDTKSIAAALLHDVVEDTDKTLKDIEVEFGKDVAVIVDGVTKLNQINFTSKAEAQAENFRKMLLAMANDIRVILIKLCDRVHNMRTLEYLAEPRRLRIAQETLDIYAPLANRMGIYWIKSELEDLSLRFLRPEIYQKIKQEVQATKKQREVYIKDTVKLIERELEQNTIEANVSGRPKHFFSIFQKMERDNLPINEVYDLIGFRVLVKSLIDCYSTLGVLHAAWRPVPGRFKDYIAMPKSNSYQSLHTTIIGPKGMRIEIQIRTEEMHLIAETGVAAHWIYKHSGDGEKKFVDDGLQLDWLKQLVESGESMNDPHEFISSIKADLFAREVFVFSPKGDLLALSYGATALDFAFAIHSEVGVKCTGAKVNGQQVPIAYRLKNGDMIEITTSSTQKPSKDWLNICVTAKAKQRIRVWIKSEERVKSVEVGRELISKDLRKLKSSLNAVLKDGKLEQAKKTLGYKELETLFAEVGYGKLSSSQVVKHLIPEELNLETKLAQSPTAIGEIFHRAAKITREQAGVKVGGLSDLVVRFSKCCDPLPGDELVGYVSRGRGLTVHSRGCQQVLSFDTERLIAVTWDDSLKTIRRVHLVINTIDKVGVLASLTQVISNYGSSIVEASVRTEMNRAECAFEINVDSSIQMRNIVRGLEALTGVIKVTRRKNKKK